MSDSESTDASRREGWYVVDHFQDDRVIRGPYESASTAGAVRTELERGEEYDDANLWIVSHNYWETQ